MVNVTTRKEPQDFVIATGRTEKYRSLESYLQKAWMLQKNEGPSIIWEGDGINEIGRRAFDNRKIVIKIDPSYHYYEKCINFGL